MWCRQVQTGFLSLFINSGQLVPGVDESMRREAPLPSLSELGLLDVGAVDEQERALPFRRRSVSRPAMPNAEPTASSSNPGWNQYGVRSSADATVTDRGGKERHGGIPTEGVFLRSHFTSPNPYTGAPYPYEPSATAEQYGRPTLSRFSTAPSSASSFSRSRPSLPSLATVLSSSSSPPACSFPSSQRRSTLPDASPLSRSFAPSAPSRPSIQPDVSPSNGAKLQQGAGRVAAPHSRPRREPIVTQEGLLLPSDSWSSTRADADSGDTRVRVPWAMLRETLAEAERMGEVHEGLRQVTRASSVRQEDGSERMRARSLLFTFPSRPATSSTASSSSSFPLDNHTLIPLIAPSSFSRSTTLAPTRPDPRQSAPPRVDTSISPSVLTAGRREARPALMQSRSSAAGRSLPPLQRPQSGSASASEGRRLPSSQSTAGLGYPHPPSS